MPEVEIVSTHLFKQAMTNELMHLYPSTEFGEFLLTVFKSETETNPFENISRKGNSDGTVVRVVFVSA